MKLYSYFRSSASYRVRCALHWKEIDFEYLPIHLVKEGGMQNSVEYRKINPMGHLPALVDGNFIVAESMAILQYLDDVVSTKRLFPNAPRDKARVLQICEIVNSGIQPLQNLKVQKLLEQKFALSKVASDEFVRHWIEDGFKNLERLLGGCAGTYGFGDTITAADCLIVPQCFTALRFGIKIESFPCLARVNANALKLEPFRKAHPEQQPDYQA